MNSIKKHSNLESIDMKQQDIGVSGKRQPGIKQGFFIVFYVVLTLNSKFIFHLSNYTENIRLF